MQTTRVDRRPTSLAYARGRVWVAGSRAGRLVGLPADGDGERRTLRLPWSTGTTSVTAGFGSLWATNGPLHRLVRLDPATGRTQATIDLPRGVIVAAVAGANAVWVGRRARRGTPPDSVLRVDPRTNVVTKELVFGEEGVNNLAVGGGFVWITNDRRDRVSRVSSRTGLRDSAAVGRRPRGVAYGDGAVWTANYDDSTVSQVSARDLAQGALLGIGPAPVGVAATSGAVWVTSFLGGTVVRIDPRSGDTVGAPLKVGRNPYAVLARGDQVWVTNLGDGTVSRIDAG